MYAKNPHLFPEFERNDNSWITSTILPSWAGFQIRNGPYGAVSDEGESDGLIHMVFAPEGLDDSSMAAEMTSMVGWVIENERSVHDRAMARLLQEYPGFREQFLDCFDEDEADQLAPPVTSIAELKRLCGIVSINVQPLLKAGVPFVGVEFGCTWDEEHGAGVLLHGSRALECGGADTAILLWMARKHKE
jgi:hypothetical protein